MTNVRACRVEEIFDDPGSAELFAEYAAECANPVTGAPPPVRAMYEALEQTGAVRFFGAYCRIDHPLDEVRLVGFACVSIVVAPDFGLRLASVERLFVSGAARRGGLGAMLMRKIEDDARDAGCEDIRYSAPVGSRLAKLLFLREEYQKTNHIFTRRLR